jgi:hypothetical protein
MGFIEVNDRLARFVQDLSCKARAMRANVAANVTTPVHDGLPKTITPEPTTAVARGTQVRDACQLGCQRFVVCGLRGWMG